ncbi:DUF4296 domain-containing protein [Tenacibaculum sp. SG-28]|uniref:DUF4296 domain-containing protein n=1 Tax=Tenacibaculum sp. SG-28 TaxID=754426 RepID=UPI000CF3FC6C|nr:DUF4296 domain-containing protein [Tenacibaculum sp. SG-28]PQJ21712.1 hypothetical protein BSU00_06425 [Tenacibaculum sp. SG-28]
MKKVIYFFLVWCLVGCTSNTIFEKPKDLIPRDTMISLLTDMYLASSAKNKENKFSKKKINYMYLVNEKYNIDTLRFDASNNYYVSKVDEYASILKKVKQNIDSLERVYKGEKLKRDSLKRIKNTRTFELIPDSLKNKLKRKGIDKEAKTDYK